MKQQALELRRPLDAYLVSLYLGFMRQHHLEEMRRALGGPDLTRPHQWFSFARAIHRRIVYHAGPTNR